MKERVFEPNYQAVLGLKQSHAITNMPFGSLLDVRNMNLDSVGGKSTRRGYAKLFALAGNEKVQSLLDYQKMDGTQKILAYGGTKIYTWDSTTVSELITGLTAATPWDWCVFQDRVYGCNGVDTAFTYNGTTYTKPGLTAPAHITLTAIAGGSLAVGDHSYVVTFYDSDRGAESDPPALATAPTATTAGADLTVQLNTLPTVSAGETATHYRIYRKAPSETIFTRVAEIDYATYVGVNYSDTGLTSGTLEVERDTGQQDEGNIPPPTSRLVCEFNNRLFWVDESDRTLLVYAKAGQPHSAPSGNYFRIGYKDGYPIEKIEKHGESLLIHKKNSVYILDDDPTVATPRRISGRGTQSRSCAVGDADNYCYRLTPSGFYRFIPTDYSITDLREEYIGTDIATEQDDLDWSATSDITSYFFTGGGATHIYFNVPDSEDYSTTTFVFDHALGQWIKYYVGTAIFAVASWTDDGKKKMIFGDDYGYVYEWDVGNSDGHDEEPDVVNFAPTSATSTTITDTSQSWTVDEFKGCIFITRSGAGANQRRRIISNTADTLTLDTALGTTPSTSTQCSIGAIHSYAEEFWNAHAKEYQERWKRMRWIVPYVRQSGDFLITISMRRDFRSGSDNEQDLSLNVSGSDSLWGSIIWGSDEFGTAASNIDRVRFNGKYHYYSLKYEQQKAGYRFFWDGHGAKFQILYDRNK